jgi:hypothetical protein
MEPVRAKCGDIVTWHWAHIANDCDTWAEPESAWHRAWQDKFPRTWQEVPIGAHRADIRTPQGFVLEVQHSTINGDAIRARENHYGHAMAWLFDARDAYDTDRLNLRTKATAGDTYRSFRWKHPRTSILRCTRRVLLDLGPAVLVIQRFYNTGAPYGGYGHLATHDDVVADIAAWRAA